MGSTDGDHVDKTGSIYAQSPQSLTQQAARPIGEWNEYEIQVEKQTYTVRLNGTQVAEFTNTDPSKGVPSSVKTPSYFGLEAHTGKVAFRNIQEKAI